MVELGQRERCDKQRVELERAMIALRGQVRPEMADLLNETGQYLLGQAVCQASKPRRRGKRLQA